MDIRTMTTPSGIPRELNQGGTGTSEIMFSVDGTIPIVLPLPSASQLCGASGAVRKTAIFKVVAFGRVTGGTTANYTAKLYCGVSLTPGSNTLIEASTARAVNSADHNWRIEVDLIWDSTSNKLQGRGWAAVANLVDAVAALDNVPTSIDPDGNGTQGFTVSGTFSAGNAGNLSYLDGFLLIPGA